MTYKEYTTEYHRIIALQGAKPSVECYREADELRRKYFQTLIGKVVVVKRTPFDPPLSGILKSFRFDSWKGAYPSTVDVYWAKRKEDCYFFETAVDIKEVYPIE